MSTLHQRPHRLAAAAQTAPLPRASDSRPLSPCHPGLQLRDKKKEIASLKQEVKRRQAELTQQQQQQVQQQQQHLQPPAEAQPGQAAAAPLPPQQRSRRGDRDLAAEIERLVEKISGLEHDIIQVRTTRWVLRTWQL